MTIAHFMEMMIAAQMNALDGGANETFLGLLAGELSALVGVAAAAVFCMRRQKNEDNHAYCRTTTRNNLRLDKVNN
eukprot:TRINITY_DN9866_c0_g1_i1.p3 TRINITY_DN9866_c0_g1~~TRINITY_DN9866_c0_g1_i1.p3  ORF type:complete len:76 (-),score=9.29 TRINITY_DN9866_c0_g1_i1:41-268(-)